MLLLVSESVENSDKMATVNDTKRQYVEIQAKLIPTSIGSAVILISSED